MLHYLYMDHGGLAQTRRELKYSLISLRADLGPEAKIAVYTDAPGAYANWPVEAVDITGKIAAWSGDGLYHRRARPAAVLDALTRFAAPVCFVDSASIIRPGFHAEVTARMTPEELFTATYPAVVMHRFEAMDPFAPLKGFRTTLPHRGAYHYSVTQSWMYNSGLIAAWPQHAAVMEDTLAFIDALIGRAKKFPAMEQFALSEVLRLNQIPVAEVKDSFVHYGQPRQRLYMANEIEQSLSPDWDDLTPPKEWARMQDWKVRAYDVYYSFTHAFVGWKK
jgi:hypothetical protein